MREGYFPAVWPHWERRKVCEFAQPGGAFRTLVTVLPAEFFFCNGIVDRSRITRCSFACP